MKLLGETTTADSANQNLDAATAIYVTTKAAHIISIYDNTGTENNTNGTIVGSIELPSGWTGIIEKDADQFIRSNNNSAEYTKINSGGYAN